MSQATLKSRIKTNFENVFGTPDDATKLDKFAEAMSKSIIDEIEENLNMVVTAGQLTVPATGIVDSVSGPCSGSSSLANGTLNNASFT